MSANELSERESSNAAESARWVAIIDRLASCGEARHDIRNLYLVCVDLSPVVGWLPMYFELLRIAANPKHMDSRTVRARLEQMYYRLNWKAAS